MMTFSSEDLPIWRDNNSNSNRNNKFCIHCSILLSQTNEDYGNNQSFNLQSIFMDAAELSSSSTTTTTATSQWLKKALFSIFKLNYLNAFDKFKEDQVEEDVFALCQNCNAMLFNLHHLYNDFMELGKIDAYLHKKLQRLDEIIDGHQQKTIKCDLIIPPCLQIEEEDEQHISAIRNKSKKKIDPPTTTTRTSTSSLLNDEREPRIVLTRLPETYTRPLQDSKVNDNDNAKDNYSDCNSPTISNCANDNNDPNDYLEIIPKVEVMEDLIVNVDDDYFQPPPSSPGSDSSAKYLPKSVQTRKTKKNKSRKEQSTQPRRSPRKRRSANSMNKTSSVKSLPQSVCSKKRSNNNKEAPTSSSSIPTKKVQSSARESIKKKKKREYNQMKTCKYLAKKAKHANPCWYCKKFFPTPADCLEHTKLEHLPENCDVETVIICDRCSKICRNDRELGGHLKKCELVPPGEVLPKTYSCSKCTKFFATKDALSSHMWWHSRDKFFACDACPYVTPNPGTLARHKLCTHLPADAPKFKCDQCDSVMKNELLYKKHKFKMHTPEGHQQYLLNKAKALAKEKEDRRLKAMAATTICADCNLDCFSRGVFLNHRRTFHGNSVGCFVCETCGLEVTTARSLREHIKFVHTDARPFLCTKCGRSFKRAGSLRSHDKITHTEEGRLKYNRSMRETNQRRKIRQNILAHIEQQQQRTEIPNTSMNTSCPQPSQVWTNP